MWLPAGIHSSHTWLSRPLISIPSPRHSLAPTLKGCGAKEPGLGFLRLGWDGMFSGLQLPAIQERHRFKNKTTEADGFCRHASLSLSLPTNILWAAEACDCCWPWPLPQKAPLPPFPKPAKNPLSEKGPASFQHRDQKTKPKTFPARLQAVGSSFQVAGSSKVCCSLTIQDFGSYQIPRTIANQKKGGG